MSHVNIYFNKASLIYTVHRNFKGMFPCCCGNRTRKHKLAVVMDGSFLSVSHDFYFFSG